jgi:predicted RNase H-like nuclease (RuvC/YqgF family)
LSEDITINEKGIYRTTHEYLSPLQVLNLRKRLQTRLVNLRTEIQNLQSQISEKEKLILKYERELKELSTPIVDSYIQVWIEKRKGADRKADELLQEVLGKEVYQLLKKSKYLVFSDKGIHYKITDKGQIYRKENNEWRQLCVIRPKYLPLPDFIISLLFNVQNKQFPFRRR